MSRWLPKPAYYAPYKMLFTMPFGVRLDKSKDYFWPAEPSGWVWDNDDGMIGRGWGTTDYRDWFKIGRKPE